MGKERGVMYLGPIYWIMDNSSLRFLEGEWRERPERQRREKGVVEVNVCQGVKDWNVNDDNMKV